ncbi:MAG: sulfatase-like hydrolase/transferase [Nannocystaceae bacterium]
MIYASRPEMIPEVLLLAIAALPIYLWPGLLFLAGEALVAGLQRPRLRWAGHALLALAVTLWTARVLMIYPPFRGFIPFHLLLAGLLVFTLLACRRPPATPRPGAAAWLLDRGILCAAVPAAIGVYAYDYAYFRGIYPTLHLALLVIAHHLLGLGLWRLFAQTRAPRPGPRATVVGLVALAGLTGLAAHLEARGELREGLPYFRSFSILGQSHVVFHPFTSEDEGPPALPDAELEVLANSVELFLDYTFLPELPDDFDVTNYNVLLITSEATRFDQTSLADPTLATTPALAAWADSGAFVFTRAFSPSSGTLHSMSGLLGMSYPSMLRLETWRRPWFGRLHDGEGILPELFHAAGYATFWVSHNYEECFTHNINGFARGWEQIKLYNSRTSTPANDATVCASARNSLAQYASDERRFFGWIFFESPHARYHAHYDDMPGESDLERYRQEVRFVDDQLAKIFAYLEESGLVDSTIVIYLSDHGEEFREHGGTHHKSTVYSESTRVPLVIRVPGLVGDVVREPVSTLYVFPWLLLHGPPALLEPAKAQIERVFAPMLARTDGGVAIELFGHDRMMASLVFPRLKFNYDFISGRYEAFDIDRDPLEQDDLFGRDPALTEQAIERIDSYRDVRRERRHYILKADQEEWKRSKAANLGVAKPLDPQPRSKPIRQR